MHAFVHNGCDAAKTPVLHLRHNVEPIEYGRCVSVVALMDDEGKKPVGVKLIQCWTDGSGQAKKIVRCDRHPESVGRKKMLDAAYLMTLAELEKIEKRKTSDEARERERVGTAFLEVLTNEGNDWPAGFAQLIHECAA